MSYVSVSFPSSSYMKNRRKTSVSLTLKTHHNTPFSNLMGALFRIRPVKGGSQGSGNFSQWLAQTYSDNSEKSCDGL